MISKAGPRSTPLLAFPVCLRKIYLDVTYFKLSPGLHATAALDTRPILNFSPWTIIYSGIRFKQMSNWRERWLPQSRHGARASHETNDVSYELQLLLEHAKLTNLHVAGVALDRRKFFDLLPHEISFNVLQALGAPTTILTAERQFYHQFQCWYQANGAISAQPCGRRNGFIQGCSFSLQASLAILSVWTKCVESQSSTLAETSSGGFLDDNNLQAVAQAPQAAVDLLRSAWMRSR